MTRTEQETNKKQIEALEIRKSKLIQILKVQE